MAEEKKSYPVLSPVKHDGKLYAPAEGKVVTVALSDDEAAALQALGVVGEASAEAKAPPRK